MKKIYFSFLFTVLAVFISATAFSQGLTCDTWTKAAWPWDTWGEIKAGDTIHCEGSYTQTLDVEGVTYSIVRVQISLLHLDGTSWATIHEHKNIIADASIGDLASGVIKKDFVVPTTFPLTSTDEAGKWLVQLRAWYGTDGVINDAIGTEYANAWITMVDGGITPLADPDPGIWIETWENVHGSYGNYGEVTHGETIHIDGTFSQTFTEGGVEYPVKSVAISILGFTSAWAGNGHNQAIIIHDANQGDLSTSIINSDLVVSESLPLNTELPEGDFYLFQVRAAYGNAEVTGASLWANAWMSIVAGGTGTGVADMLVADGIALYPNPAAAGSSVRVSSNVFSGDVEVKVFSVTGAVAYNAVAPVENLSISTAGLAPGLYTVVVKSGDKVAIEKLIVQ